MELRTEDAKATRRSAARGLRLAVVAACGAVLLAALGDAVKTVAIFTVLLAVGALRIARGFASPMNTWQIVAVAWFTGSAVDAFADVRSIGGVWSWISLFACVSTVVATALVPPRIERRPREVAQPPSRVRAMTRIVLGAVLGAMLGVFVDARVLPDHDYALPPAPWVHALLPFLFAVLGGIAGLAAMLDGLTPGTRAAD